MSPQTRSPSRLRLAGFVFVGVYPLVTAMLYLLVPATPDWPIWQRNLLMVPVIVAAMVWVIIPRIHRHFSRWL